MATLLLTHRTEKRRPPVLHDPLDLAAASRRNALFALAVIDAEMVLEIAKLAIGPAVIAQRRSAGLYGVIEHRLDGVNQRRRRGVRGAGARRNGGGAPLRRQPRPVQGLARIDVAEAGHDGLVEKRRLEAGFLSRARGGQQAGVESVDERLGPDLAHQRMA